tara:strand:+ start:958 stop:1200 length:243 start_codon:yes stop_codon:yes gene_type:complete
MKNTIKILPRKIQGSTHGQRKFSIQITRWLCDLEVTLLNGEKRIVTGMNFMKRTKLKKDALILANNEVERMLSKGDFYFI